MQFVAHELQEAVLVPLQLFGCAFLDYLHFRFTEGWTDQSSLQKYREKWSAKMKVFVSFYFKYVFLRTVVPLDEAGVE